MKTTGRRRRRLRRAALPLGTVALFGLHAALASRGHPLPPPAIGGPQGRIARPREVAAIGRAAAGRCRGAVRVRGRVRVGRGTSGGVVHRLGRSGADRRNLIP
ncbi:hypothetical protein [Streptomyces sp. KL116D]|uniref:hypothetical protein n=1 Tax=Streptomyces sp. KL116D TaxID=3045152 RepID=UPI003558F664